MRSNGRQTVYAVYEAVTMEEDIPGYPVAAGELDVRHAATFWSAEEAARFYRLIDAEYDPEGRSWIGEGITEEPVVILDDEVFYAVEEDPVPIGMIADSAEAGAYLYIKTHAGSKIPHQLAELALSQVEQVEFS